MKTWARSCVFVSENLVVQNAAPGEIEIGVILPFSPRFELTFRHKYRVGVRHAVAQQPRRGLVRCRVPGEGSPQGTLLKNLDSEQSDRADISDASVRHLGLQTTLFLMFWCARMRAPFLSIESAFLK